MQGPSTFGLDDQIPLSLLTGFLGSGKTTVLNHLLRQPGLERTAVVVNEFGAIGLDHELVAKVEEDVVVLQSGCLCCTIRQDLVQTLDDLLRRRDMGEVLPIDRILIETTGLADPAPILHTLMTDPVLVRRLRLDGVLTTVDGATGLRTLEVQPEALKQAAVADRLLLTKTDLVEAEQLEALRERLRRLNPAAPILEVRHGRVEAAALLEAGFYDPASKGVDVQAWLRDEAYQALDGHHHHHHDVNRHDERIRSLSFVVEEPIGPEAFDLWLSALTFVMGPDLLRLKGLVHVRGLPGPMVLHGVQHVFHPPVLLEGWPSDDRRSRIVVIGRDLSDGFLREGLAFLRGHVG